LEPVELSSRRKTENASVKTAATNSAAGATASNPR
jgi:hypothetical protein